jgi:DNA polymerase-3 subunit gamma/tau
MADIALYRKYRPQNFENLVGQEAVQRTLLNAIKSGHLSHAYLFCGPRGTGKTTTARLVAKAINCISPEATGESCNRCEYCQAMGEGRLVDLIEIDAASNRGIDEIRDLREKIKFSPTQAPHKIYIIDEVHMLTTPAFNALLKTLEEPPAHAYFILATTEAHKLPDTIISRCQRFDFHRMEDAVLIERLRHIARQESIEVEENALTLIARSSEGGMRDAISLFEQLMSGGKVTEQDTLAILGLTNQAAVQMLYDALEAKDMKTALTHLQNLHKEGYDLYQFNREFLHLLRQKMLEALSKKENLLKLLKWIEAFQQSGKELKQTLIPQLPLEMAIIKCVVEPGEENKGGWFSAIRSSKKEASALPASLSAPNPVVGGLKQVPAEEATPLQDSPSESDQPSAAPESIPMTLESVQQQLPRLVEHVRTPQLRHSFKSGWVKRVDGEVVEVEFQSKFYLTKVETSQGKNEIEKAFEQVFGRKPRLHFYLAETTQAVDESLAIFGGELIEE